MRACGSAGASLLAVVAEIHRRNQDLARRARSTLVGLGLIQESVPEGAFVLMVELGDRVLDLAFRDRVMADREVIQRGADALSAYVEQLAGESRRRALSGRAARRGRAPGFPTAAAGGPAGLGSLGRLNTAASLGSSPPLPPEHREHPSLSTTTSPPTPPLPTTPEPPRAGWPLARRMILGAIGVVLLSGIATAALALGEVNKVVEALGQNRAVRLSPKILAASSRGAPETLLLVGDDRRPPPKGNPGGVVVPHSNEMLLVRIDPSKPTISMLSIPRELEVKIEPPGGTPVVNRINVAYTMGGIQLMTETIKRVLGISVNHVFVVTFPKFKRAVNEMGCVYMTVDRRYHHVNEPGGEQYFEINLEPGYQRMCGQQALEFVANRHEDTSLTRDAETSASCLKRRRSMGRRCSKTATSSSGSSVAPSKRISTAPARSSISSGCSSSRRASRCARRTSRRRWAPPTTRPPRSRSTNRCSPSSRARPRYTGPRSTTRSTPRTPPGHGAPPPP